MTISSRPNVIGLSGEPELPEAAGVGDEYWQLYVRGPVVRNFEALAWLYAGSSNNAVVVMPAANEQRAAAEMAANTRPLTPEFVVQSSTLASIKDRKR
ncbi:MAG TPA: hypothetical protein K8W01_15010 [Methylorubrum populi]|uniref:Uncharacterized protein n=1 Tax=Methylorubrum populi TaxID=223967 RepID=A0A921E485_9HYPH|nr:hypothetical protein [Methylorubrum populi]